MKCSKCGKEVKPPYVRLGGRGGDVYCMDCISITLTPTQSAINITDEAELNKEKQKRLEKAVKYIKEVKK